MSPEWLGQKIAVKRVQPRQQCDVVVLLDAAVEEPEHREGLEFLSHHGFLWIGHEHWRRSVAVSQASLTSDRMCSKSLFVFPARSMSIVGRATGALQASAGGLPS